MADITKCFSQNCPIKDKCYRVQATSDPYYQSWSNFEEVCNEQTGYSDFFPIGDRLSYKK